MERQNDILIKEVKCTEDLIPLMRLAERHTHAEYDCDFEGFVRYILKCFHLSNWKFWIAKNKTENIGYIIAFKDVSGLRSQVNVFDIFVVPEKQGRKLGKQLMDAVHGWAKDLKVKRVKWNSSVEPRIWRRLFKGQTINSEYILYGEIQ